MKPKKTVGILLRKILAALALPAVMGVAVLDAQEGLWTLVFPPSARTDAGMVYDADQGRLVLFGGFQQGRACQDTWLYEDGAWTRFAAKRSAAAPSARGRFASCYDKARGEMLVFGGTGLAGPNNELWAFKDGWKKRMAPNGPSAREGVAMACDAHTGDIILFGGKSSAGLENDTWKYANGRWTKLSVATAPPARWRHALVYDAGRRAFLLYGGRSAGYLNDTWVLKGTVWTRIAGSSAGARASHGMVYDAKGRRCILFGGANASGVLGDTWAFKSGAWSRITGQARMARAGAALAYDAAADRVVLFGGWRGENLFQADTLVFQGNRWAILAPSVPAARSQAGLAYDMSRNKLVLFGGTSDASSSGATFYSDTWERDAGGWAKIPGAGPAARRAASLAYDPSLSAVVLHGGRDAQWIGLTDTWTFDGATWTRIAQDGPESSGAMAYYPKLGALILVDRYYRTYKRQAGAWTQLEASLQPYDAMEELSGAAMAYDARRDVLVLFGGLGTQYSRDWPPLYDTVWEFDGTAWTSHAKRSGAVAWPRKRHSHLLFYDPVRQRIILSQGKTTCYDPNQDTGYYNYRWLGLGDTWSWDGTAWTLLTQTGPARDGAAGVYDSDSGTWTAFGGRGYGPALEVYPTSSLPYFNDLHVLKPPLPPAGSYDLGITSFRVSKLTWESGDVITASVGVANRGSQGSRSSSVWVYASLDDTIGENDILLGRAVLPPVPPGGGAPLTRLNIVVDNLQAIVPEGGYNSDDELYLYIGAVIDRFEQARDASLVDNVRFLTDCVTLMKPSAGAPGHPPRAR